MAQAAASSVTRDMETAMHRLSTGKRINAAADDAAGVAISSRLDSTVRGLNQSIRNALDAQALIDTAEGGMQETETILQRIRELSIQASNDTNSADDRANLNAEAQSLLSEIDRISSSTTWAGQSLLDGTFTDKSFQVGTGTMAADQLVTSIAALNRTGLGLISAETPESTSGEAKLNSMPTVSTIWQGGPSTTHLKNGNFLVSWAEGSNIYGQIIASTGQKIGSSIDLGTFYYSLNRKVTALENGGFVLAYDDAQGGSHNIKAKLFDDTGNALGSPFDVETYTGGAGMSGLSISTMEDGGFIISWSGSSSVASDGSEGGVFFRRYDVNGNAQNSTTQVNAFISGSQRDPSVSALEGGGYVVTWTSEGGFSGIYSQIFDDNNNKVGSEFLTTGQGHNGNYSEVVKTPDGGFTVVYTNFSQDDATNYPMGTGGIAAQRYDNSGTKIGSEILINTTVLNHQQMPSVSLMSDGGLIVTWESFAQDGDSYGIFGQRLDKNGIKIGNEFQINENSTHRQMMSSITSDSYGNLLVAWRSDQDGVSNDEDIYYRTFSIAEIVLTKRELAVSTVGKIDKALQSLNSQRASLGAISNRLDHIVANNTNAATNVAKSLGRIQDADFAAESTSLAKNQILLQASTAMLAQANASKQNILDLLQN